MSLPLPLTIRPAGLMRGAYMRVLWIAPQGCIYYPVYEAVQSWQGLRPGRLQTALRLQQDRIAAALQLPGSASAAKAGRRRHTCRGGEERWSGCVLRSNSRGFGAVRGSLLLERLGA